MPADILITGLGVVTPLGLDAETFFDALAEMKVATGIRPEFRGSDQPYALGAVIDDFDGKHFIKPRKAIKVMCRPIQFGFAVGWMAAEQAGLFHTPVAPDRLGVVFGAETFYADPLEMISAFSHCITNGEFDFRRWGERGIGEIPPLWMLQYLANMIASHLSIAVDARGPSNTICQGDVSSSLAIIEAAELLARGWAEAVIAGGASSQTMTTGMVYRGAHRLSRRLNDPERASRPFDAQRDGVVLGEGGGAIVIETSQSATNRKAQPLAHLSGWAQGFAFGSPTKRSQRIAEVIALALQRAGVTASQLSHVNATGYSTVEDDRIEAQAIQQAVGDVPVIGLKGNLGHLGPGADVVELVASILSLGRNKLPGAPNYETADPACPVNVNRWTRSESGAHALKLSINNTGQIAALVLSTP